MAAVQPPSAHLRTKAKPAEPLVASSLVDPSALIPILEDLDTASTTLPAQNSEFLRTGVKTLDDALGHIFQSGRVIALSSEASSQRDDLARTLLVDCLVGHEQSAVAVMDTTGNFDVVGLYTLILKRLEEADGTKFEGSGADGNVRGTEERAARCLDRVRIMRVFDFVGIREAVSELRDGLEGRTVRAGDHGPRQDEHAGEEPVRVEEVEAVKNPSPPRKRTEVADSEDEDEEMLFDTEATTTATGTTPEPPKEPEPVSISASTPPPFITTLQQEPASQQCQPKVKLILLSNFAHVLTPLLKKDSVSTNALAATFLTTLSNLTRTHSLHTILLNPASIPRSPSPARQPPTNAPAQTIPPQQQSRTSHPPPPPSIFSSQSAVPALLGLLSRYVDAHVLLAEMPRRKADARVYFADAGGRERGKRRGVEMMGVCEVLGERWGGGVGSWASLNLQAGKERR